MDRDANTVQNKRPANFAAAVFFLIWAGVGWVSIFLNSDRLIDRSYGLDPGPALLPVIALTILTIGAVVMFAAAVMRHGHPERKDTSRSSNDTLPMIFLASVVLFPVVMETLGYVWATLVSVFAWCFLLAPDALRQPIRTAFVSTVAAVSITLLVYVGFELVVGALLPR